MKILFIKRTIAIVLIAAIPAHSFCQVAQTQPMGWNSYNCISTVKWYLPKFSAKKVGMKPFVELSFMPSTLSSGPDTVFHYKGNITPPKDYEEWETLIQKIILHWVERYSLKEVSEWFFEVWNEPNLSAFWKGSQDYYFSIIQTYFKSNVFFKGLFILSAFTRSS